MIILSLGKREYSPRRIEKILPREEKIIFPRKSKESPQVSDYKTLFQEKRCSPQGGENRLSLGKREFFPKKCKESLPKRVIILSLGD